MEKQAVTECVVWRWVCLFVFLTVATQGQGAEVRVDSIWADTAIISWDAVHKAVEYVIYTTDHDIVIGTTHKTHSNLPTETITGLTPNTEYIIRVNANITTDIIDVGSVHTTTVDICGQTNQTVSLMIAGGNPAAQYAWPWQLAMFKDGQFVCGASLINSSWAVTAAHCVTASSLCEPQLYSFRAGSVSLIEFDSATEATQERWASDMYVHSGYDFKDDLNYDNDIALFKMNNPFLIDSKAFKVNTVCIPTPSVEDLFPVGTDATVTGWGERQDGSLPANLYQASVKIINQTECVLLYDNETYKIPEVTDNMICAGVPVAEVDACQGDSGGPLVSNGYANLTDRYYLVGVISFGHGCGLNDYPGVYTRVTKYANWILSIIKGLEHNTYVPDVLQTCGERNKIIGMAVPLVLSLLVNLIIGLIYVIKKIRSRSGNHGESDGLLPPRTREVIEIA